MKYGKFDEPVECHTIGTGGSKAAIPCREMIPLNEMMQGAGSRGMDILIMAERIEDNLFGAGKGREAKPANPICFRDALTAHIDTLFMAAEVLSRSCGLLGL